MARNQPKYVAVPGNLFPGHSCKVSTCGREVLLDGSPMHQSLDSKGYFYVRKRILKRDHIYRVHRLCLFAKLGQVFPPDVQVNHINSVRTDNSFGNLEPITNQNNMRHAYTTGSAPIGQRHWNAKYADADVQRIIDLHRSGVRIRDLYQIGERCGMPRKYVQGICCGLKRGGPKSRTDLT